VNADGKPYFTMKRVQGESLRAILTALRRGDPAFTESYGPRRLLNAFSSICLAVALAHSRGILHRDIKPANIMFGDFGEVYLLDWGIAKVRAAGAADRTQQAVVSLPAPIADGGSKMGDLLGTIGYMAPEQARGEPLDERADVYSLGATLFEILTLERLHASDAAAALQSTLFGVEARPSVRAPDRRVARELEELCVRATSLEPEKRPSSARELHDVIERVLDGDRDLERRQKLAAEHTARARGLAEQAFGSGVEARDARERAIQEAHRAIVLDAANRDAVDVLTALARNPAADTMRVADEALHAATMRMRRSLGRTGALLFAPWMLGVGLGSLLGLRSAVFPIAGALILGCGALFAAWRARRDNGWITLGALLCADAGAAISGSAFGPFLLVPGLLACTAIAFTAASAPLQGLPEREPASRLIRHASMAAGVLAFLIPLVLEWTGLIAPSMVIRDGTIVILPRAVDFPATWTIVFLVVVNAVLILVPAIIASRVRDHSLRAEREVFKSVATMRQLLPNATKTVIEREPEE
jgi:serine/threonine-protein kinase